MAYDNKAVDFVPRTELVMPEDETGKLLAMRNTYYGKDVTDDEFKILCLHADAMGLSVINREILGIKVGGKMIPYITVAGLTKLAVVSGNLDGLEGPFFCGTDGKFTEVWLQPEPPVAAMARAYRKGISRPFTAVVLWKERKQESQPKKWDAGQKKMVPTGEAMKLSETWAKMPAHMLGKVAISDVIKRAGLINTTAPVYIEDEEDAVGEFVPQARLSEEQTKLNGLRAIHGSANKAGLSHDDARSVVKAVQPGITSMKDPEVTADDLYTASGVIDEFDADAVDDIIETGEFNVVDVDDNMDPSAPPSPMEEWRIYLKECFAHWTAETASVVRGQLAAATEATEKAWKWSAAIELAPTPKLRDNLAEGARRAGLGNNQIDAAIARRQDSAQVARTAEKQTE